MTVFDASVLVDALVVAGPTGDAAREALRGRGDFGDPFFAGARRRER